MRQIILVLLLICLTLPVFQVTGLAVFEVDLRPASEVGLVNHKRQRPWRLGTIKYQLLVLKPGLSRGVVRCRVVRQLQLCSVQRPGGKVHSFTGVNWIQSKVVD